MRSIFPVPVPFSVYKITHGNYFTSRKLMLSQSNLYGSLYLLQKNQKQFVLRVWIFLRRLHNLLLSVLTPMLFRIKSSFKLVAPIIQQPLNNFFKTKCLNNFTLLTNNELSNIWTKRNSLTQQFIGISATIDTWATCFDSYRVIFRPSKNTDPIYKVVKCTVGSPMLT